jgi:DNA-binding transcriptional MerR regulator
VRVSEAARLLSCPESFLRRAERTGRLPAAKRDLNGSRVYSSEDLEALRKLLAPRAVALSLRERVDGE